MYIIYIY